MADGVAITAGSGTTVATDDAGASGHVQLFKLAYSADGVATLVQCDANGVLVNTELPAAAALSDTTGNPTTPMVGSPKMIWDGSQWTRAKQTFNDGTALGTVGVSTTAIALADMVNNSVAMSGSGGDAKTGAYVAAFGVHAYNGATMDRVRGDTTNGLDVDVTRMPVASTATLANVAASATSVTLDAANSARLGLTIFNDSTSVLYVKLGATASATSFTVKMDGGAYWEMPPSPVYTGVIDGIWVTASGNARVTDITA